MKKKIFALLAWSVVFASFVACGSDDDSFDDDVSADEYVKSADDLETMKHLEHIKDYGKDGFFPVYGGKI